MIKNYKQYLNEGVLNNLKGPTEEEVMKNLSNLSPSDLIRKSVETGYLNGIKTAIENGYNIIEDEEEIMSDAVATGNTDVIKCLLDNGGILTQGNIDSGLAEIDNEGYFDIDEDYLKFLYKYADMDEDEKKIDFDFYMETESGVNESILDKLKGPTDEEILKNYSKLGLNILLQKSINNNFKIGIINAIERGVNLDDWISDFRRMIRILDMDSETLFNFIKENVSDIKNVFNFTVAMNYIPGITYALNNGADIHADDDSALMFAVESVNYDLTKFLLYKGANVHTNEDVCLRNAVSLNVYDITKLLLDNGADVFCMRNRPLNIAKDKGVKMIKLIEDYMDIQEKEERNELEHALMTEKIPKKYLNNND